MGVFSSLFTKSIETPVMHLFQDARSRSFETRDGKFLVFPPNAVPLNTVPQNAPATEGQSEPATAPATEATHAEAPSATPAPTVGGER